MKSVPGGRTVWLGGLAAIAISFGIAFATKPAGESEKGLVTYVDGRVKKRNTSAENWQNAYANTAVVSGDRVRTYRRSRAELELAKLDIVRLAPETTIDILKLYEETKERVLETSVKVTSGDIWAQVNSPKRKRHKFKLSTPIAGAAITGTTLRIHSAPEKATQLKVYTGEVVISNAPERADLVPRSIQPREVPGPHEVPGPREVSLEEWAVIVKRMQQVTINPQGKILSMGEFSEGDRDEKSEWVRWNKERDRQMGIRK